MLRFEDTSHSPKNASQDSELLFELTTSSLLSLRGNGDGVDPHDMLFIITRTCEFVTKRQRESC